MRPFNPKVLELIKSKYELVDIINLVFYDLDLEKLDRVFLQYSNYQFRSNQRLLIVHQDTDYYVNSQGNTMYNVIKLLSKYNIAPEFVILLTNNYGVGKEIEYYARSLCNSNSPRVVYTSLWYDFPDTADQCNTIPDNTINYLYCCLNGVERSHRVAQLCYLQKYNLIEKGMISYHFGQ
jgi:hypothetical protein